LVTKIRILSDLLQVSAIQGKKNDTSPLLRRLIHELMDFIAGSENISASVDADLLSSFQPLVLVFLEGISRISTLDELAIAWIRNSHEAMFDAHHNMMPGIYQETTEQSPHYQERIGRVLKEKNSAPQFLEYSRCKRRLTHRLGAGG
jgi:hypothetical protein